MTWTKTPGARTGVTVLETILAFSILTGALLTVAVLIDTGLGYSRDSRMVTQATAVARSRVAEIRSWLQGESQPNYAFDRWNSLPDLGVWRNEADYPGFESKTDLTRRNTFTPAAGSEMLYKPAERRPLNNTLLQATVNVRWGGRSPGLQLVTLIADGRRKWAADPDFLVISGAGGNVARGGTLSLSAVGYDDQGQEITDLMLSWTVQAGTSCGMITEQSRDGHTATFCHQTPKPFGPGYTFAPPGTAWVAVSGRLWGVEKTARVLVHLQ